MMNFGDLVKLQQQQEKQPSTPTPTATITSTTQDPATALLVSGDATFALGLLDNSGGRDDDLGRQEQQSQPKDESFLDDLADLMEVKGVSTPSSSSSGAIASVVKEGGPQPQPSSATPAATLQSEMIVSTPPPSEGASSLSSPPSRLSSSTSTLLRSILPREVYSSLESSGNEGFMFLTDTDGRLTTLSGSSFLGISPSEIEGLPVYALLHPDDHGRFRTTQQQVEVALLSMPGQPLAASKVLDCRIRRERRSGDTEGAYEFVRLSIFPIRRAYPPNLRVEGRELTQCQFFCLAKKYPTVAAATTTPPTPTTATTEEVFTLRLEPFPPGFNVVSVDTSRMSDASAASLSKMELNRRSIMELCHPQDRASLVEHLNQCVTHGGAPPKNAGTMYRARLVDRLTRTGGWVRVRLRTILVRPSPTSATRSFISAVHTVIDPAELLAYVDENVVASPPPSQVPPNARTGSANSGGLLMALTDNSRAHPHNHHQQNQKEQVPGAGKSNNNNIIQSKSSPSPSSPSTSSTDETQEKNLLLKQLLNVNYSRGESPSTSSSAVASPPSGLRKTQPPLSAAAPSTSTSPNSGILKLLSQHTDKNMPRKSPSPFTAAASDEQLQQQQQQPLAGVKRSASGSLLSPTSTTAASGNANTSPTSDSGDSSSVCKQNPALISLLSKPTTNSVAVPPPVPTKWHQEPREKLPRTEDGLKKFLPPHPAERAAGTVNAATSATSATATVLQHRIPTPGHGSTASTALSVPSSTSTTTTSTTTTTSVASASPTPSSCAAVPNPMLDVGNDDVLSEILEGVIDIQEILPNPATATAVAPSVTATVPPETRKSSMSSEIENIEKFLVGSSSAGSTATVAAAAALPVSSRYQRPSQSQSHQRHRSGPITMVTVGGSYPPPIQTTASSSESSSLAASNNNHQQIRQQEEQPQQIQHRRQQQTHQTARRQSSAPGLHSALGGRGNGSGSSAPVPRMNELLQQVPPNVSIPDCPDLDSIVMLQQRRRMSSGGGPVSNANGNASSTRMQLSPANSSTVSPISSTAETAATTSQQQPRLSSSSQLLMQQLSAGPINNSQTRPQHIVGWAQNSGSYRMHPQQQHRYATQQQQQQQQLAQPFQAPMNRQREMMMPGQHSNHQQHQQQIQGYMNRSPQLHLSVQQQQQPSQEHHGGADGDHGRSLLQQLLSE